MSWIGCFGTSGQQSLCTLLSVLYSSTKSGTSRPESLGHLGAQVCARPPAPQQRAYGIEVTYGGKGKGKCCEWNRRGRQKKRWRKKRSWGDFEPIIYCCWFLKRALFFPKMAALIVFVLLNHVNILDNSNRWWYPPEHLYRDLCINAMNLRLIWLFWELALEKQASRTTREIDVCEENT